MLADAGRYVCNFEIIIIVVIIIIIIMAGVSPPARSVVGPAAVGQPAWWNAELHDSHILMQAGPTVFCNVCGCNDGSARVMGLAEPCLRRASERQLEGLRRLRRGLHPTRSVVLGEPARLAGRGRPRSRSRDRREAAASGERGEGAASGARGRGGA